MKATGKRVIVRLQPAPVKTKSGIYFPDNAREEQHVGKVLAIGPLVPEAWGVSVGDVVMVPMGGKRYFGSDWCPEDESREHWEGNWREVLGKVEAINGSV